MKKLLMTPGPVELPECVRKIMAEPMIHHRTPEFEETLAYCLREIKKIFKTKSQVFFQASTGSGGMESALLNTVQQGKTVLVINSGKFGERWVEMAKRFGYKVIEYKVPWGEIFDLNKIQDFIKTNPDIQAIFTQACETSTGVLHPVDKLGQLLKNKDILLVVDAITALGTTNLDMDAWGLDVVVGGSQKAFMLPTGLSMIGVSERAWDRIKQNKNPIYYWDLKLEEKANQKNQTQFSSCVAHIRALREVLELVLDMGVESFVRKHEILSRVTRESLQFIGLQSFPQIPSPSLTALKIPAGIDAEQVQQLLEKNHGITIMGGQDQLKGKIIRIGHMGAIWKSETIQCIEKLSMVLHDLGVKISPSEPVRVAHELFEKENLVWKF